MDSQIKSLNDIPPYLFYNKKDSNNENDETTYIPIIIKGEEPNFVGIFKIEGDSYLEVAQKLADAFSKLPVSNRIEGISWKNKKGAPKQVGFDMG